MITISDQARQMVQPSVIITINSIGSYDPYTFQIGGTTYSPAGAVWFDLADTPSFTGTFKVTAAYIPYEFIWDFGDGAVFRVGRSVFNNYTVASHQYKSPGSYTIIYTIVDNTGHKTSAIKQVFVH